MRAILWSFRNQLLADKRMRKDEIGVMHSEDSVMLDGVDEIQQFLVNQRPSSGPRTSNPTTTSDDDDQGSLRLKKRERGE